jgi:hypothetical protein
MVTPLGKLCFSRVMGYHTVVQTQKTLEILSAFDSLLFTCGLDWSKLVSLTFHPCNSKTFQNNKLFKIA